MLNGKLIIMTLAWLGTVGPGLAADFSDPTWPCIQRKVENLSLGLMWPHQIVESGPTENSADIEKIAGLLALRRVELEDLQPQVAELAVRHDGDPDILGLVFQRVFDFLSKRRKRIIAGIGEFSLNQIDMAEKIDLARVEMEQASSADPLDYDRIDALEEQLDWDQLIYTDRQRSITYLCETPQILERRLFAISQMLQQLISEQG